MVEAEPAYHTCSCSLQQLSLFGASNQALGPHDQDKKVVSEFMKKYFCKPLGARCLEDGGTESTFRVCKIHIMSMAYTHLTCRVSRLAVISLEPQKEGAQWLSASQRAWAWGNALSMLQIYAHLECTPFRVLWWYVSNNQYKEQRGNTFWPYVGGHMIKGSCTHIKTTGRRKCDVNLVSTKLLLTCAREMRILVPRPHPICQTMLNSVRSFLCAVLHPRGFAS